MGSTQTSSKSFRSPGQYYISGPQPQHFDYDSLREYYSCYDSSTEFRFDAENIRSRTFARVLAFHSFPYRTTCIL